MAFVEKLSDSGRVVSPFATVSRYFEGLPDGWASFPTCVTRASLLGTLADRGALDALEALPERLGPRVLLDHLAATAEWLPEVVHVATLLAVRDVRFAAGPRGDEDFQRWLAQLNRELLDQPENSGAMQVASSSEYVPRLAASGPCSIGERRRSSSATLRAARAHRRASCGPLSRAGARVPAPCARARAREAGRRAAERRGRDRASPGSKPGRCSTRPGPEARAAAPQ